MKTFIAARDILAVRNIKVTILPKISKFICNFIKEKMMILKKISKSKGIMANSWLIHLSKYDLE